LETQDYAFYIKRLRRYLKNYKITLICYTLIMPNHPHLVVRQNSEISVSNLIALLHTSYSMYFNKKYDRVGHLFQCRFKQKIIDDMEGLVWLSCYIHLNSEHDGVVEKAQDYPFSSYPVNIGKRMGLYVIKR
jgi:REP element-mobilizing transposase RayT